MDLFEEYLKKKKFVDFLPKLGRLFGIFGCFSQTCFLKIIFFSLNEVFCTVQGKSVRWWTVMVQKWTTLT